MSFREGISRITDGLWKHFRPLQVLQPQEAYGLWAPTYDQRKNNAVLYAEERAVLPLFDVLDIADKSVLDIGCGTGRHIEHLLQRHAARVTGIDSSEAMLSVARGKFHSTRVALVNALAEDIPFPDGSFDAALSTLVLSHLPHVQSAVDEASRVLKSGGEFLVSDLHWNFNERGWHRTFHTSASEHARYAVANYAHDLSEYDRAFFRAGFEIVSFCTPNVDSSLEPFFSHGRMSQEYVRYKDTPLLVLFHLRKK